MRFPEVWGLRKALPLLGLAFLNEWKGLPLDMRLINFRAIIG